MDMTDIGVMVTTNAVVFLQKQKYLQWTEFHSHYLALDCEQDGTIPIHT